MAKGYWIVNNVVNDPDTYERYKAMNAAPLKDYGARFLVRGGQQTVAEGDCLPRSVVIEFPSYQAALDCFYCEAYQAAKAVREDAAEGRLVIAEGYDG